VGGTVGTRSRAIRRSTSDDRVGCSASDGRCAPARPALNVSTRLLPFLPCALASADGIRPFPLLRLCERAAPDAVVSPKIARVFSELMWKAKLSAVDIAGGCMASNVGPLALQGPPKYRKWSPRNTRKRREKIRRFTPCDQFSRSGGKGWSLRVNAD
jgi:hypothetical protein